MGSIAIIEDDVLVRQSLGDCMESAGYAVESFDSAEQFLASGSAENAACLIIDVQLPGITGLELQDRLAGADNRVPIVFVSAQGTQANREKAMTAGRHWISFQAVQAGRAGETCRSGDPALNAARSHCLGVLIGPSGCQFR